MPNVSHLLYNHHYTKIIAGLIDSSILILPIPAESSQEDDDYDPGDK